MPFKVTDNVTGQIATFENEPTDQDLQEAFGSVERPETAQPEQGIFEKYVKPIAYPVAEALGMAGGALAGSAVAPIAGTVAGAGLGYAGVRQGEKIVENFLGKGKPETITKGITEAGKNVATGAVMEMGGQVIGKVATTGLKAAGKLGKQILGATTGAGPGTMEEALKGTPEFKKAMRGQTSGQEIVENVKDSLQTLKNQRALNYQGDLAEVSKVQGVLNNKPISDKLGNLMKQYNVSFLPNGKIDTSKIAMGKAGRNDVVDTIEEVLAWDDATPLGLDTLKRRLDDFYSDSSQARSFVASLKKTVAETISKQVPQYGQMTAKYAEATNLIKDIESNLMLRKSGISGRITPDQTLRRLTSAMRENFELRRDLVNVLGEKAGEDLAGQIAGYSAEQWIPRGLFGKGLATAQMGYIMYLNPKFWPILAASSPRVVGEFLSVYGKGINELSKTAPATYKTLGFAAGKAMEVSNNGKEEER